MVTDRPTKQLKSKCYKFHSLLEVANHSFDDMFRFPYYIESNSYKTVQNVVVMTLHKRSTYEFIETIETLKFYLIDLWRISIQSTKAMIE